MIRQNLSLLFLLLISNVCSAQTENSKSEKVKMIAANNVKSAANNKPDFIKDSLEIYVEREMQRWNIPGVAISIIKDGKVIFIKGFGVRDIKSKAPVDENTLFQIASNTKAYTGTAIAMLQSQKRLKLDDRVKQYLPYFELSDKYASEQATVRDVLCHRLGFQTFQGDFLHWDCNMTTKDLLVNLKNLQPVYPFRYRYGYTNMGFVAAGEIIKAATDTSWQDFFKFNFFIPLKMGRTSANLQSFLSDKNASKPYTFFENRLIELKPANIDNIGACASINSCVKDISNWIIMQLDSGKFEGKEVVPFSAIRETRKSQMIVSEPSNPNYPTKNFNTYGLGWELEDYAAAKVVSHNGGANGFVSNTTLVPSKKFGFTILTNNDANWFFVSLQQQLLDYIMNMPYDNRSANDFAVFTSRNKTGTDEISKFRNIVAQKNKPDLPLSSFIGKYKNDFYGVVEIKPEADQLIMTFEHHPGLNAVLSPLSGFNFMAVYSDVTYGIHEFLFTQEGGKVKSVKVKVNDFIDYMPYDFVKTE
ncbi:MAG TPA: serine hydrolase [Bacteroidia bacterium]|nr:serine hydrolase [Bacteroidia bacterium]HNU33485.1 serine hydrolase [Bacteroidia bacterium]